MYKNARRLADAGSVLTQLPNANSPRYGNDTVLHAAVNSGCRYKVNVNTQGYAVTAAAR
jgi:hypothetical protein